jgi:hypothetical protein
MVVMRMPPGVSSARAKSLRARARSRVGSSSLRSVSASRPSGITAQSPSSLKSRRCISAAAALV